MTSTGQKLVVVLGLVAIPESARSALPVASNTILAGETSSFSLERRRSDLAIAWAWTLNYRRRGEGWPGNRRPFKWRIANSGQSTLDHHFYPPTRHLGGGLPCWVLWSSWWWHKMPDIRTPRRGDLPYTQTVPSLHVHHSPPPFVTANIDHDSEPTALGIKES